MVGHLLEYHPAVLALRELVAEGALGRVNYIYSNRLNFGKIRTRGEHPLELRSARHRRHPAPGGRDADPGHVQRRQLHHAESRRRHRLVPPFSTGVRAHIFVSWLNPFKEQKLVVVGDRKMAVFDDSEPAREARPLRSARRLDNRQPVLQKGETQPIAFSAEEPLRRECEHFLDCVRDAARAR